MRIWSTNGSLALTHTVSATAHLELLPLTGQFTIQLPPLDVLYGIDKRLLCSIWTLVHKQSIAFALPSLLIKP
jgi:hypothetical protein